MKNRNLIINNYNNEAAILGNNNDEREGLEHVALDKSESMQLDSNPFEFTVTGLVSLLLSTGSGSCRGRAGRTRRALPGPRAETQRPLAA